MTATFNAENDLFSKGLSLIAGVDEAGRGPLAGPVVAAAVILNADAIPAGLADSKTLSEKKRERLFNDILETSLVGVASVTASAIDTLNIRMATLQAMRQALDALAVPPHHALIDGRDIPPHLACPATALIDGDALCLSIAAASIVAKVMRDGLMKTAAVHYPGYGFEKHKGYGTAAHLRAIADQGACPLHRMSFAPLHAYAPHTQGA